jgi:hypothetical protein
VRAGSRQCQAVRSGQSPAASSCAVARTRSLATSACAQTHAVRVLSGEAPAGVEHQGGIGLPMASGSVTVSPNPG